MRNPLTLLPRRMCSRVGLRRKYELILPSTSALPVTEPRLTWTTRVLRVRKFGGKTMGGRTKNAIALTCDRSLFGIAKPGCRFNQRVEHDLQIKGRATDDYEDVGGGGLLLERFAQLI